MNLEYIKVGETYYFPVTVSAIHKSGCIDVKAVEGRYGYKLVPSEARTLCAIRQGPASKYDPCRLLRKGDKVQVKRRDGRCNGKDGEYLREAFCKVADDEVPNELVRVLHNATEYRLDPAYLELVEPVEELEPYKVQEDVEKSDCPLHDKTNGTKNDEPTPKYDPYRKFREGDIVTPCSVKGRWFGTAWKDRSGIRFKVTKDEDEEGVMWVKDPDSLSPKDVEAVFFQLVTPVEELEPYYVDTITTIDNNTKPYFLIKTRKHEHRIRTFYANDFETIEQTRAAAEAECARLNEEYRKKQSNG